MQAYKQHAGYVKQSDSIQIGGGTVVGCTEDQRRAMDASSSDAGHNVGGISGSVVEGHTN